MLMRGRCQFVTETALSDRSVAGQSAINSIDATSSFLLQKALYFETCPLLDFCLAPEPVENAWAFDILESYGSLLTLSPCQAN